MATRKAPARRAIQWLGESPDATNAKPAAPQSRPAATTDVPVPAPSSRPRKAERRAARRAAFYTERRRAAPGPRALFEVAADQLRALDDERAFTAATQALDALIARYAP